MRANQWTLKPAKHEFPSAQKSRGPGGNLQGARIHSSCFGGLGSSLPGETIGNRACAKAQRDRGKKWHIKEATRDTENKLYRFISGDHPLPTC